MGNTTQCAKGFSNSTCQNWRYHFPLETSSSSSVFIICRPAPKMETLDSSDTPSSHRVLSALQPRSLQIQLLPPLHSLLPTAAGKICLKCRSDCSILLTKLQGPPDSEDHLYTLKHGVTTRSYTSWLQPWDIPSAATSNVWLCPPGACSWMPLYLCSSESRLLEYSFITVHILLFLLDSAELSPLWSSLLRPPN